MSPKQRNPFLFRNNSAQAQQAQRRAQRLRNIERAQVPTSNITITNELKFPKKPLNPMIPISGPIGTIPSNIYYISFAGYLYTFTPTGLTIVTAPAIPINAARSLKIFNGNFYFCGIDPDGSEPGLILFKSIGGAPSNRCSLPTPTAELVHFDIASDGRIWAFWNEGDPSSVYYSDDQGDSWVLCTTFPEDGQDDLTQIACHATNPDYVVTTFINSLSELRITSTVNRGTSWGSTLINSEAGFIGPIVPVYHVNYAGDKVIAIFPADTGPQQLYSLNADPDLSNLNQIVIEPDVVLWWGATVNPDDPDVIVAVAADAFAVHSFYVSTDRGLSYTLTPYPLSDLPFGMIFVNNVLYLAIIIAVNTTSFYQIADIRTSMSMELLFTVTDTNADPEVASDNFAVS